MGPGIWIGQEGGSSLTETHSAELAALETGPFYLFKDWPVAEVPRVGSAVYTIWDVDGPLVYVGMSGRSAKATGNGPWGRLNSHASGRRSGDQFCIYVCDRLILGGLHNRLHDVAAAALSLDQATREYIERGSSSVSWPSQMPRPPLSSRSIFKAVKAAFPSRC